MVFHGISWYFTNIWEHDVNIHIIGLWKNKGYDAQHRPAGSMADFPSHEFSLQHCWLFPTLRFLMVFVFSAQSKSGEVVNIGSMVLVYMLTWLGYIDGKCYIEYMDPMGLFWMFFIFKHRHGPWHGMMPNAMTWAPLFFFRKGVIRAVQLVGLKPTLSFRKYHNSGFVRSKIDAIGQWIGHFTQEWPLCD